MTDSKIIVTVDEDLEELIPGFLENRIGDIQVLRDAIAGGDIAKVQSVGHSLKGVGGGYGFDEMSELGGKIEAAARENDAARAEELVNQFADYMERVEVVYE